MLKQHGGYFLDILLGNRLLPNALAYYFYKCILQSESVNKIMTSSLETYLEILSISHVS